MTYTSHWLPAKWFHQGGNLPPSRVVIHTAEIAPAPGAAAAVAGYFHRGEREVSAHVVVDDGNAWGCVGDDDIAFHAPPNPRSLGIELATRSSSSPATWANPYHTAMLANAAQIVGAWCRLYHLPVRLLTVTGLRNGERGVCGHVHVSAAFGQTNHTDPGPAFPWARFMQLVAGTEPAPPTPEDPEMIIVFATDPNVDPSQLLQVDGRLFVVDENTTAAGLAAAGVKTAQIGHVDFAQLKAKAEQ